MIRLAGDLDSAAFPPESKADCTACPLNPPPGDDPAGTRTFVRERCCTYQPDLPNFLAGQALTAGGVGADLVRARLEAAGSVYDVAVISAWDKRVRYEAEGEAHFGTDGSLRCPYWVGGELNCGLHESRTAACRTWYCRHDAGLRGLYTHTALRMLLAEIETALAAWCAKRNKAPWPWASAADWERYYRACHHSVQQLTDPESDALGAKLVGHRITLHSALALRDAPMPAVLQTHNPQVEPVSNGRWRVIGYSRWDPVEAPAAVGVLFAVLAGGGDWREAIATVEGQTGLRLDDSLVRALWYAGVLVSR